MMLMRDAQEPTAEQVEDEIAQIGVCEASLAGRLMVLLAWMHQRKTWAERGFASLPHWLAWRTMRSISSVLALMADKSLSVAAGRAPADRNQVVIHVDAEVLK